MIKLNLMVPGMKSTQTAARPECNSNDMLSHAPAISQKNQEPKTVTHNDDKIALVLFLQVVLPYGIYFDKSSIKCMGHLLRHYTGHMSVSSWLLEGPEYMRPKLIFQSDIFIIILVQFLGIQNQFLAITFLGPQATMIKVK